MGERPDQRPDTLVGQAVTATLRMARDHPERVLDHRHRIAELMQQMQAYGAPPPPPLAAPPRGVVISLLIAAGSLHGARGNCRTATQLSLIHI